MSLGPFNLVPSSRHQLLLFTRHCRQQTGLESLFNELNVTSHKSKMASSASGEISQAQSPSRSQCTEPFSIKNLLNLPEERTTPDRTKLESPVEFAGRGGASPQSTNSLSPPVPLLLQPLPMSLNALNGFQFNPLAFPEQYSLVPPCPAWVFASRYSRQGIPTGEFANPS